MSKTSIEQQVIERKIYVLRGRNIMLDRDLAELYGVSTKVIKRQVRRNRDRFPDDFMFELSKVETENWRRQFGTSNLGDKMGLRYMPFAFTEHGILMLSSVLNSRQAIAVKGKGTVPNSAATAPKAAAEANPQQLSIAS